MTTVDEILKRKEKRKSAASITATNTDMCKETSRRLGGKFSPSDISKIMTLMGEYIFQDIINTGDYKCPFGLGKMMLRKQKCKVQMRDGKIWTNKPVDWKRTLALWAEDPNARELRKRVHFDVKDVFSLRYKKNDAYFKYSYFTNFNFLRRRKLALRDLINQGQVDTYLVEEKDEQ